jgi:thioredoxin reductase (NADPH)
MSKPVILTVDDDPAVSAAVTRDVRLDSMKRVASAVGEGAMSIYLVHRYLATI